MIDGVAREEMDAVRRSSDAWDGRELGYVPPPRLTIDPALRLFEDQQTPDAVTYQVLRWKLWSINLEHSDTIKRVSGSPAIVYMDDFATSILTAAGENIVCGPTIQYFTGLADLIIRWTLENRSADDGIQDRDIFLQNDPYIGAAHQIDTALYMPVFWKGELFCWLFNSAHQGDLGGMSPGSFCVSARDIFDEPTPVPPVRLVRGGTLQPDVLDLFVRKSRTPGMIALQIRSQIAGLEAARERILALLERYGPQAVCGTMHRMLDDCATAVEQRLRRIPDGEFDEVTYVGGLTPEDRASHRYRLAIRKQGTRLVCSNEGTDPQFGSANCTYSAWRSAIICAVSSILAYDQMSCPGGVLRVLRFEPVPGLLNCCRYPAAVTTIVSTTVSVYLASQVLSRIVLCGPPDIASTALAAGAGSVPSPWVLSGIRADGRRVADVTGDGIAGGTGASRYRDGIDNGGAWFMPGNVAGDVEEWEQALPMLYLYRREHPDSGGAGRHRGGNGVAAAITGHRTESAEVLTINVDTAVNATPGLAGGLPGHSGNMRHMLDTDLGAILSRGQVPGDIQALEAAIGDAHRLKPKSAGRLLPGDVMMFQVCGSGGFGDPLRRPAEAVASDVVSRSISARSANAVYGVVIRDGAVSQDSTRDARAGMRRERLEQSEPPQNPPTRSGARAVDLREIGDGLAVAFDAGHAHWACADCRSLLAPVGTNYKLAAATLRRNATDLLPDIYPETATFCDDRMEMRHALCPECGTILATEFCRADDPPRFDIRLDEATLETLR